MFEALSGSLSILCRNLNGGTFFASLRALGLHCRKLAGAGVERSRWAREVQSHCACARDESEHNSPAFAVKSGAALNAAFGAIEEVESQLSIYRPGSQLSRLSGFGFLAKPHPDLLAVLACAHETSRRSRGAFDITV